MQFRNIPYISFTFLIFICVFTILFFNTNKLNIHYLTQSSFEVTKRIEIWHHALSMIKQKPFIGYGSNYMDFLHIQSNLNLNAHNQFLEYMLEYGILGIIMLLATLLFSIFMAIRSKDYFYLGFIALSIYFCLFESIFNNQTGVVFFSLFNALFLLKSRLRIKTIKE
jgi:O-antigen ligase